MLISQFTLSSRRLRISGVDTIIAAMKPIYFHKALLVRYGQKKETCRKEGITKVREPACPYILRRRLASRISISGFTHVFGPYSLAAVSFFFCPYYCVQQSLVNYNTAGQRTPASSMHLYRRNTKVCLLSRICHRRH